MSSTLHHQHLWGVPANRPVTTKTPSSLATLNSQPSSPPYIPKRTIATSSRFPISSNGDLSGIAFPESSLPINSDLKGPNVTISESTFVASQRSAVDTTERQVITDAEPRPPHIDYLSQRTINHCVTRTLRSQNSISSMSIKDFTAMCLHGRQVGQQTKVNGLWELVPSSFSDTRFDLYFNKTKIQGIKMISFKMKADINASYHEVCVYGCKTSKGKRQWLAGTKYIEHVYNLVAWWLTACLEYIRFFLCI
jgi:hypothetical protein